MTGIKYSKQFGNSAVISCSVDGNNGDNGEKYQVEIYNSEGKRIGNIGSSGKKSSSWLWLIKNYYNIPAKGVIYEPAGGTSAKTNVTCIFYVKTSIRQQIILSITPLLGR